MRFYFNLAGAVYDPDKEGHDLATMSQAGIVAAKLSAVMLQDSPELAWLGEEFRVEVTDDHRLLLFTIITLGVDSAAGGLLN